MKQIRKITVGLLVMVIGLAALTGCNPHASPESLSKTYVSAVAKSDYVGIINCTESSIGMSNEAKDTAKKAYDAALSLMPAETKEQIKTTKFVKYEKISGDDTTETGKVTVSYKEKGTGERKEDTSLINFKKIDGKWYMSINITSMQY